MHDEDILPSELTPAQGAAGRAVGHGFKRETGASGLTWAACTCGWETTQAYSGDRRFVEAATGRDWDEHCQGGEADDAVRLFKGAMPRSSTRNALAVSAIDEASRAFKQAIEDYHEQGERRQLAVLRLLAAHALTVVPEATHMLMEASDEGPYMCVPSSLAVGEQHVGTDAWNAYVDREGGPLHDAPSWLPWDGAWERFADTAHPFTNIRRGYYALDLRRIDSDAPGSVSHTLACRAHAIGCAVENLRDAGLADLAPVAIADGYLADGTVTCLCSSDDSYLVQVGKWIVLGITTLDRTTRAE